MKTGAFWAAASALFLIAGAFWRENNILLWVSLGYSFLAVLKAGIEA